MRLPARSHWLSGGLLASGDAATFCSPGCFFRYSVTGRLREPWVIEYDAPASTHSDAHRLVYALGSDVVGPMGPDLVPLDPSHVATFTNDHHPRRIVRFHEVTASPLNAVDGH